MSGTHGKTTTTSIISKVLLDLDYNPTINVGGIVDEIGGNSYIGGYDYFVAEACEYTNSFLDFCPSIAVVTNVEEDHLDFFKDLDDIRNSFRKFINLLPDNGLLVINKNIDNYEELIKDTKAKVLTYGCDHSSNFYYENVSYDDKYYQSFDVYKDGKLIGRMKQKLIGRHNILNFLASFAVLDYLGIPFDKISKSLLDFKGARRRLEIKKVVNGVTYIDDYAHHPTEIEASINALNEIKYNNMYIIFQPHTFTRTKSLLSEFIRVLGNNPIIILAKIYPAREKDLGVVSSKDISDGIKRDKTNKNIFCEYLETFKDISEYILNNAKTGDIVVTMGAGDVYKIIDLIT